MMAFLITPFNTFWDDNNKVTAINLCYYGGVQPSINKIAFAATWHCLTGCAIGEIVGMVVSTAAGWSTWPSIILSVVLAFVFGYSLTMRPLLGGGMSLRQALRVALASDTASIAVMELTDNAFILAVPSAIDAGLTTFLFWWSLLISLVVAFAAAYPLNRYLISKGKGHAAMPMGHHHH